MTFLINSFQNHIIFIGRDSNLMKGVFSWKRIIIYRCRTSLFRFLLWSFLSCLCTTFTLSNFRFSYIFEILVKQLMQSIFVLHLILVIYLLMILINKLIEFMVESSIFISGNYYIITISFHLIFANIDKMRNCLNLWMQFENDGEITNKLL